MNPAYFSWPVVSLEVLLQHKSSYETQEGAYALRKWQQGRCAICWIPQFGYRQSSDLVLDHDHDSALIRSYLCPSCNNREGQGHDGPFDVYRAKPPAAILGIEERYWGAFYGEAKPDLSPIDVWKGDGRIHSVAYKGFQRQTSCGIVAPIRGSGWAHALDRVNCPDCHVRS